MTLFLRLNDFDFLAAGPIAELDLAADHRLARKVAAPTDPLSVFTVASLNCYLTR
jgi:hypothetical protein